MGELINLNSSVPLIDSDIPAAIARDSEVTSAIAAHIASEHASLIPLGAPATISASLIEDALRESYKSGFFAESHYLSSGGNGVFASGSSNGGFAYLKAEPGYPGILGLSTGSASNGAGSSVTGMGNNSSGICLGDGSTKYLGIMKIPVLRDATNDYVIEVGFQSAGTSIGLDACCFVYDSSSSPNWQFHTRNNSDLSILITAIPVIANTWYRMEIIVANQIATFSIDGATQVTSNKLPLASRMVGAGMDIRKISGTTGRDILIDYQQISQKRAENSTTIPISTRTLVDADIPASIARDSEVSEAIANHASAIELQQYSQIKTLRLEGICPNPTGPPYNVFQLSVAVDHAIPLEKIINVSAFVKLQMQLEPPLWYYIPPAGPYMPWIGGVFYSLLLSNNAIAITLDQANPENSMSIFGLPFVITIAYLP